MRKILGVLGVAVILATLSGCATSRTTVAPIVETTANPEKGEPVKFVTVEDLRVFQVDPKTPDIPSLRDGEIANKDLTVRAIGRKRNGFGMALGDVLLPEGETVTKAVEASATNAFRNSGYRVVNAGDPAFDAAVPVTIKVREFWNWINIGFWALTVSNRVEAEVQAPVPGIEKGVVIRSEVSDSMTAVFESDWPKMTAKGLADFQTKLQAELMQKSAN